MAHNQTNQMNAKRQKAAMYTIKYISRDKKKM